MTERVTMVPMERAKQLGEEIGLPGPMATRSAFHLAGVEG